MIDRIPICPECYRPMGLEDELKAEIKELRNEVTLGIKLHGGAMQDYLESQAELKSARVALEQIRDCAPANMYRDGKLMGARSQMIAAEAIKYMDRKKK